MSAAAVPMHDICLYTVQTKITSMIQWFDRERAFSIFILGSWRSILISQFYHILKESFLWFELIGPAFCSTFLFFRGFPSFLPLSSSGTKTWTNLFSSPAIPMLCFPLMWSFSVSFLLYMYPQRAHRNFTWNQQPFFIWISCLVVQSPIQGFLRPSCGKFPLAMSIEQEQYHSYGSRHTEMALLQYIGAKTKVGPLVLSWPCRLGQQLVRGLGKKQHSKVISGARCHAKLGWQRRQWWFLSGLKSQEGFGVFKWISEKLVGVIVGVFW